MSEIVKGNLKDSKSRYNLRIGEYIVSSAWRAVPVFAFVGILISYQFKLTMNKDVWFWFFSSIAQTFAALVALVAIFLLSRLDSYNATINKNKDIMRILFHEYIPDETKYFDDEMLIMTVDKIISRTKSQLKNDKTDFDPKSPYYKISFIIRAREENNRLEIEKKQAKNQMKILL